MTQNLKFSLEKVENIVGKGENVGYILRVVKKWDCVVKSYEETAGWKNDSKL